MSQFTRPRTLQKALLGFDLADRVFGSTDVADKSIEAREQRQNRITLAKIAKKFELQSVDDELAKAMHLAAQRFWTWHGTKCRDAEGYGENKKKVRALEAHLAKAALLLQDQKLLNRLHAVATNPTQGIEETYGKSVHVPICRAVSIVTGLAETAKLALKTDGRDNQVRRRDDVRSAAEPLLRFWTDVALRKSLPGRSNSAGEDFTDCTKFLCECLTLLDTEVSFGLIAKLGR